MIKAGNKFKSRIINFYDRLEELEFRDIPLNWMSNINSHNFAEEHPDVEKHVPFFEYSSDTKENFEHIMGKMPNYWCWQTDTIDYYINRQGFRNPFNFDNVDWKNSYVLFGCSMIAGVGNKLENTVGHYVQEELDAPVINMGSAGGSAETVFNNLMKIVEEHGVPKGCLFLWPQSTRQLDELVYKEHSEFENDWRRVDVHPAIANTHHVSYYTSFYRKHLIRHTVRALLKGTYMSEIADNEIWVADGDKPAEYNDRGMLVMYQPHPEWLHEDMIMTQGYFPNKWQKINQRSKEWFFNEFTARDIEDYSIHNGPNGGHHGPFVNRAIAKTLVQRLKKI